MRQTQIVTVLGNPRGKGRPRFSFKGHAYTDAVTTAYEGRVKAAWKSENNFCFEKSQTSVLIKAFFPVPVSLSKRKRAERFGTPYLGKPDADNIAKIILDALNGVAWKDDMQINLLCVEKWYVKSDEEEPRVEVQVSGGQDEE